eukprot:9876450-Karenia_brevis.AAC.1
MEQERLDKEGHELHRESGASLKESDAARYIERVSHRKKVDEMRAAIMEPHRALSKELNNYDVTKQ